MPIVAYTPELYPEVEKLVQALAPRIGDMSALGRKEFVDYYYTGQDFCRLWLYFDKQGRVVGSLGVDNVRFEYDGEPLDVAFPSNFYTTSSGAGGYLYRRWLKSCAYGVLFGGSADTLRIFRGQGWTFFPGVELLYLNQTFAAGAGAPIWERAARFAARRLARTSLAACERRVAHARERISVVEETEYTDDLLVAGPCFRLRFAPTVDYLAWRYALDAPFVRYRLFRVLSGGVPAGYVVVGERAGRTWVAHCDGRDPSTLAFGVLFSVLACIRTTPDREVLLACSHREMIRVYTAFGFRVAHRAPPLAMGGLRGPVAVNHDTGRWLVNFDWGDNGLRRPFADEPAPR